MINNNQTKNPSRCPICHALIDKTDLAKSKTANQKLCVCGNTLSEKLSSNKKIELAKRSPTPKSKKSHILHKVKESLKTANYDEAIEMLTNQMNTKPSEEIASYYLIAAQASSSKKNVTKALKEINKLKYTQKKEWWLHTINTANQSQTHFNLIKICTAFAKQFKGHYLPLERLGQFQMKEKNHREAIKSFTKCIGIIEDFKLTQQENKIYAKALKSRANIYSKQKSYDLAIADYKKAIGADKNDYVAIKSLAEVFLTTHKYPQSLKKLNQAIIIKPKYLEALLLRAKLKKQIKDFNGALDDLKIIIKIKPDYKSNDPDVEELVHYQQQIKLKKNRSGVKDHSYEHEVDSIHATSKSIKKESEDVKRQLKEEPNDPFLLYELANFYFMEENYDKATEVYNQALEHETSEQNIAYILNGRGLTYSYKDEYIKAILDYTHALERNKSDTLKAACYMNRAIAKGYINDFRGSVKDLKEGIKFEKQPEEIQGYHYLLSRAYMELQEFDKAEKEISICIKHEDDVEELAEFFNMRASCKAAKGAQEGAITDLQKALKFKPETTRYLINLAYLQEATRKYDQSLKTLEKALNITSDPEEAAEIYILRAGAKINSKEPELAIQDCLKVLELDQNHAIAYFQKGLCNDLMGNINEAIDDYEKALSLDPELEQAAERLNNIRQDDSEEDYDEDDENF